MDGKLANQFEEFSRLFNRMLHFSFASLGISCRELSDRSFQFGNFFELTQAGAKLARVVVRRP